MRSLLFAAMLLAQSSNPAQVQTGTVTGRLLALDGTPAAGVRVSAMPAADATKPAGTNGPDGTVLASLTQTDASGRYRLENVPPGRYFILAGFVDSPTYFPGVTTTAAATAVSVAARATVSNIDFQAARSSTGLSLKGRLKRDTNEGVGGLNIFLSGNDQYPNTRSLPDGSFEFLKLRPGTYAVSVSTPNFPPQQIVLTDKDISNLEFVIPWTVDVTGNLSVEGGGMRPNLTLTFAGGSRGISSTNARDTFRITLPEGAYAVAANGIPSGFFIKSIRSGSTDLLSEPLKLSRTSPPPPIAITLGVSTPPPWVKLSGRVTGLPNTGTSQRRLLLNGPSADSADAVLGADGSFEFPKLLPGSYSISINPAPISVPQPSIIVPNTDLGGVLVSFPAVKEITGKVAVEDGGPLPATSLSLTGTFGVTLDSGQPSLAQLLVASSQPRNSMNVNLNLQKDGTFKATLPEGQYRITATPQFRNANGSAYTVKAFTYGTTDLTNNPISVTAADSASLNLTMGPTSRIAWSKVTGRVTGLDSSFLAANPLMVTLNGSGLVTNWTSNIKLDGSFEFPKVYPGNYTARIGLQGATQNPGSIGNLNFNVATATIILIGTDITGVEIAVPRQKDIAGKVTLEGRGLMPRFTIPLATLTGASIPQVQYISINPLLDGSFSVTVMEGERQVGVTSNLPAGYTLKAMTYGTTDVLRNPLRVTASDSAELRVTLTTPNLAPVHVSGKLTGVDDSLFSRGPVTATMSAPSVFAAIAVPIYADRSFEFPEVFPGNYTLRVAGAGILNSPNVPVAVASTDITNIEITVPRQKEIIGRVILEGSAPMPRFQIPLPLPALTAGAGPFSTMNINPQPDGSFRVTLVIGEHHAGPVTGLPTGYAVKSATYGTIDILKDPLKISESDKDELRVTLSTPSQAPVHVRGRVSGLDNSSFARGAVTVSLTNSSYVSNLSTPVMSDGTFEFPGVFPGIYTARLNGTAFLNFPANPIIVANADVEAVEITMPRQKEISGRIILEGRGAMPRFQIPLPLSAPNAGFINPIQSMTINPQQDGTFKLTLPVAEHRAGAATGLPAGYSVKSITYGSIDLSKNPLKISESDTAELLVTVTTPNRAAVSVRGRVSGLDDSILARGSLNLSMTSPAYVAVLSTAVMPDGTFEFSEVFSGLYFARVIGPGVLNLNNVPVTVGNTGVQFIEVAVPRQKEITGRMILEGSGPMARLAIPLSSPSVAPGAGIGLLPGAIAGPPPAGPPSVLNINPQPDGTFRVTLLEGEQRMGLVSGLPPGYTLKSLTYGTTDILKEPFKVAASDTLELRATLTTSSPTPVQVRGRVIGLDAASFARGPVNATMTSAMYGATLNSEVSTDGSFEFPTVYPGSFVLRANGISVLSSPNLTVTVANTDIEKLEIRVPTLTDITGHVVIEGGGPYPLFAVQLTGLPSAIGAAGPSGTLPTIRPGTDGTFHIGLPAGESRAANFVGLPPGYRVKSFSFGSTDLLKNPMKIAATDTTELQITLVNAATPVKVSGRLEGVDLNVPAKTPVRVTMTSPSFMVPLTVDVRSDGTFEFSKVYPGNYRILAETGSTPTQRIPVPMVVGDKEIAGLVITVPK